MSDKRTFQYKGFEVIEFWAGMRYAIPALKNWYLHSMHDVDLYIRMKTHDN
jgi:hypothetical protein